jgi:hypothetical protein
MKDLLAIDQAALNKDIISWSASENDRWLGENPPSDD